LEAAAFHPPQRRQDAVHRRHRTAANRVTHSTTNVETADRTAEGILRGEKVAFTGTLASMTHKQAAELVVRHGGEAVANVSHQTTLLVIGEEGWPLESDGRISVKLEQAHQLREKGQALRLLSESEWLQALGLEAPAQRQTQLYTPAMLSQILKLSVHEIRRWERLGLIRAVKRVFRLPYFDFREVAEARRLSELVGRGVPVARIVEGFQRLNAVRPMQRTLDQLQILASDRRLLYRDDAGLVDSVTGQRLLDFDPPAPAATEPEQATLPMPASPPARRSAAEWREEGCRLADENELAAAVDAFRLSLLDQPTDPSTHYHLGESLYRLGNRWGAIERYYCAVELDHEFIEAWTQLGCLLAETEQLDAAIEAFQVALETHPDFPDAHFHLAEALHQSSRPEEAEHHWKAYLQFDQHGPWAETARQRLGMTTGEA
jgi:tetratricopeptide (TPR) repeat protein